MAREIEVEKSILIDKPKQAVYNYLKLTRNQENFSTWNMADPGKQTSSEGIDGTVGFIYSWDSKDKNVGAGSQEITGLVEGDCIEYALRFERPMKNIATSKFILDGWSASPLSPAFAACPAPKPTAPRKRRRSLTSKVCVLNCEVPASRLSPSLPAISRRRAGSAAGLPWCCAPRIFSNSR